MGQHFLLSAAARSISLCHILNMTDQEAVEKFAAIRWGASDQQTCPHCGVIRAHRYVRLDKRWRCRDCYKAFSVTSGTMFQHHKLPLQVILGGMVLYANAVKGLSALQLSRDLDVQYKTAYVLLHKLRESIWKRRDVDLMTGHVEMDGGYVNTYMRPKNKAKDRPKRNLAENQNPNKCVMLVLRERHEPRRSKDKDNKLGAKRTRVFILPSENSKDILDVVHANVARGATIYTDEAPGHTTLSAYWNHHVVNHGQEYSSDDGTNENQAESYISRFRRMMMGQIHRLHRKYLDVYANEVAFREDRRRTSNGEIVKEMLGMCLSLPPSRDWAKYWQGNKRMRDSLMSHQAA